MVEILTLDLTLLVSVNRKVSKGDKGGGIKERSEDEYGVMNVLHISGSENNTEKKS